MLIKNIYDMARSTRLVIVIKNIYVYFIGSKTLSFTGLWIFWIDRYILSDEFKIPFYSTSKYPFTLRVTGMLLYE